MHKTAFISYARADAKPLAEQLYHDLVKEGLSAWLDTLDMLSGAPFVDLIDRAIQASDYFLLIYTPGAVDSIYCRDEWKKALEHHKPIIPLLHVGKYEDLPQEGKVYLNDAPDFRLPENYPDSFRKLAYHLKNPPSPPAKLYGVPDLLNGYVGRDVELDLIEEELTNHRTTVLTSPSKRVGLQGMGGIGKTTVAIALTRRYFIRRSFTDGIFWLTLGTEPRLETLWGKLTQWLGGDKKTFDDATEAADYFQTLTHDKELLLILDDLWNADHARAFSRLGDRCRLLVTSRFADYVDYLGAVNIPIDKLNPKQAIELLQNMSGKEELLSDTNEVLERCDYLPLAIGMIGAMVKGKPPSYWQRALNALREAKLDEIAARFPEYPYPSLFAALEVSLQALDPDLRERYYDFAIFPDDVAIPETVMLTFWDADKSSDPLDSLALLANANLIKQSEADGSLILHDLQLAFIRKQGGDLQKRHARLLAAYNPSNKSWHEIPHDGYLYFYLGHHLTGMGADETWNLLRLEYEWLAAKLEATQTSDLLADFTPLVVGEADKDLQIALRLIQSALGMSNHILVEDTRQLAHQLHGRLWVHRDKAFVSDLWAQTDEHEPLELLPDQEYTPFNQAGGALLATLRGHSSSVKGAIELSDGRILSWSYDHTLRLWSREGQALAALLGHTKLICGALALSDGHILSWSWDNTLRLWSREGQALATLLGHTNYVTGAIELSDSRILSWSWDNTLRLWSREGQVLATLSEHTNYVTGAIELSDSRILSWSWDNTLRLWSREGQVLATLSEHTNYVTGAIELSDSRILSWSRDNSLHLWNGDGQPIHTLRGHTNWVNGAVELSDDRILSWSNDNTLRLWSRKGEPMLPLIGHSRFVNGAVELSDGCFLSWSNGGTLRLWNREGQVRTTFIGHSHIVNGATELLDGNILSWSWDNTLRLWSGKGEPIRPLRGHTNYVNGAVELSDSRILSWSDDHTLRLWSGDGQVRTTFIGHSHIINGATKLLDGNILSWSDDHALRLWSGVGQVRTTFIGHSHVVNGAIELSDSRILSWSDDHTLRLWSRVGQLLQTLEGHSLAIDGAMELSDGRILSAANNLLRLWSGDGQALATLSGHTNYVNGATELLDGNILSWSSDNTLRLWNRDGQVLATLIGHSSSVTGAVALNDNRVLSWSWDNTLRLWSGDGQPLQTLEGHSSMVTGAVVLDDGRILSWSWDNTLRLWSGDGQPLQTLEGHSDGVTDVVALPDGRFLSWSNDHTLRLWSENGRILDNLNEDKYEGNRINIITWAKKHHFDPTLLLEDDPLTDIGRVQAFGDRLNLYHPHTGRTQTIFYADANIEDVYVLGDGNILAYRDSLGRLVFLQVLGNTLRN